jgi:acetyl esterase/lipase
MKKILLRSLLAIIVAAIVVFLSFKLSPWPSALLIRNAFNKEGVKMNQELAKHVKPGLVTERLDLVYNDKDPDAKFDLFYPTAIEGADTLLPVIVWVHGGGWISGDKSQVGNYCRILASKGYAVVAINYSLAPERNYPMPVWQTNQALQYIYEQASKLHIDRTKIVLAGDSGGAHIVTQVANIMTNPGYASVMKMQPPIHPSNLKGMLLFCGPYDVGAVNMDGDFGQFLKTVLWSYSGNRDYLKDPYFKTASVIDFLSPAFPPSFISAGNGDPLLPQSVSIAEKLTQFNVRHTKLFFPDNYSPALPHEYQFNLDEAAGRQALDSVTQFLQTLYK